MHLVLLTLSVSAFIEAGGACVRDHGDGIWYQEAFGPSVKLCSPTFAAGVRVDAWSVGVAHLFKVRSESLATVRDQDYDSNAHKCLANCSTPATFKTNGSAHGVFLRHEWKLPRGFVAEAGGLVFQPRQTVEVSNWRENGDASKPAVAGRYDNKREWSITPSIGAGWQQDRVRVMARFYPWIKTGGDAPDGSAVTGLYNGPTATLTASCDF